MCKDADIARRLPFGGVIGGQAFTSLCTGYRHSLPVRHCAAADAFAARVTQLGWRSIWLVRATNRKLGRKRPVAAKMRLSAIRRQGHGNVRRNRKPVMGLVLKSLANRFAACRCADANRGLDRSVRVASHRLGWQLAAQAQNVEKHYKTYARMKTAATTSITASNTISAYGQSPQRRGYRRRNGAASIWRAIPSATVRSLLWSSSALGLSRLA